LKALWCSPSQMLSLMFWSLSTIALAVAWLIVDQPNLALTVKILLSLLAPGLILSCVSPKSAVRLNAPQMGRPEVQAGSVTSRVKRNMSYPTNSFGFTQCCLALLLISQQIISVSATGPPQTTDLTLSVPAKWKVPSNTGVACYLKKPGEDGNQ